MAKGRMISSEIWEDDFFTSLTIFERLLWIGILSGCADDQGRLQDSAILIRSKVFPVDDITKTEIENGLCKLAQAGIITRYSVNGKNAIQVVNWWKYQTPRWAGKSSLPPPPGWTDRERYHAAGNEIIESNWKSQGGYIVGYSAPNTINDGDGDGDVKGDVKGEGENSPLDSFEIIQRTIETRGILLSGADDIQSVNEIVKYGATPEDVLAGIDWKSSNNNGKPVRYVSQLIGPTKTAMARRLQRMGVGTQYQIENVGAMNL